MGFTGSSTRAANWVRGEPEKELDIGQTINRKYNLIVQNRDCFCSYQTNKNKSIGRTEEKKMRVMIRSNRPKFGNSQVEGQTPTLLWLLTWIGLDHTCRQPNHSGKDLSGECHFFLENDISSKEVRIKPWK